MEPPIESRERAARNRRGYEPSEWFVVPPDVIDQSIDRIISGETIDFVYDAQSPELVGRG